MGSQAGENVAGSLPSAHGRVPSGDPGTAGHRQGEGRLQQELTNIPATLPPCLGGAARAGEWERGEESRSTSFSSEGHCSLWRTASREDPNLGILPSSVGQ